MTRGRIDGWGLYLAALACLIPVVVPSGPARTAIVDFVIVAGLVAFAAQILIRKEAVRVPFLGPVLLISVGSIAAVVNAESPGASVLAMAQDAYLFLWFIMLVHLLRHRDLTGFRILWVWVANVIAVYALVALLQDGLSLTDLLRPRGRRAYGTFYDPNMFGGYLVMSMFIVLSLGSEMRRLVRWGSILLMTVALLATKSNGAMLSLMLGLGVWALVRALTRRWSPRVVAAMALIVVGFVLGGVWLVTGTGIGSSQLQALQSQSFLARAGHSSEGRFRIWQNLQRTYAKSPLGIGPGNSRMQTVTVQERMRPGSMQAKEAHNDYLAYAIERGPLGLIGLLALLASAFWKLVTAWRVRGLPNPRKGAVGPLVAATAGALVAACIHALTIEVLHFRHFWLLLAIVCAIQGDRALGRSMPGRERFDTDEPARRRVVAA